LEQEERCVRFDKDLGIEAYRFKGIMQKFPNHFHEHYVIGFIENGKRLLFCRNKEYIVGCGDLLLINPMDNHACEQLDQNTLDYRSINISREVMEKAVKEITGKAYLPNFIPTVAFQSEYVILLRELHEAIMEECQDFRKEEAFYYLIEQLITDFTNTHPQVTKDVIPDEMKAICDYIDEHYTERITLEEISSYLNINKYSMLRSFARQVGITPYRYLETIRINKAKKLLESGVSPLDAAMQAGFSDQSHFTNHFKEYIGLTPKQYQNIFKVDGEN